MKNVKASKKSEFRAVREGTLRSRYIALMNGSNTLQDIAKAMGTSNNNARVTIHCLKRDCGIGHSLDKDGRITAIFPKNVTQSDAIATLPVQPLTFNPEPQANDAPAQTVELQQAA